MLSNAYFLAKFRFDAAENEPAKNLQNTADVAGGGSDRGGRGDRGSRGAGGGEAAIGAVLVT